MLFARVGGYRSPLFHDPSDLPPEYAPTLSQQYMLEFALTVNTSILVISIFKQSLPNPARPAGFGIRSNRHSVQCPGTSIALILSICGHWLGSQAFVCRSALIALGRHTPSAVVGSPCKASADPTLGVRLPFSRLESVALIRLTHLSKVDAVRSYSRMV
jgi:hypothetical protein